MRAKPASLVACLTASPIADDAPSFHVEERLRWLGMLKHTINPWMQHKAKVVKCIDVHCVIGFHLAKQALLTCKCNVERLTHDMCRPAGQREIFLVTRGR